MQTANHVKKSHSITWMFHSSSVRIPFVFWTSSFERFISCHRLRHLRPSAGQQKQLDGDQICDCQQKQVAFLRWTEGFLRNWYTIRNMWRWEEFPNHMGGMLWGKYGTLTNRGIFCCQIKFPTSMEHYQWMMFYVCKNSMSMNFNHRTINESKSYVFFRQKYLANIGEGSFPAE